MMVSENARYEAQYRRGGQKLHQLFASTSDAVDWLVDQEFYGDVYSLKVVDRKSGTVAATRGRISQVLEAAYEE